MVRNTNEVYVNSTRLQYRCNGHPIPTNAELEGQIQAGKLKEMLRNTSQVLRIVSFPLSVQTGVRDKKICGQRLEIAFRAWFRIQSPSPATRSLFTVVIVSKLNKLLINHLNSFWMPGE